MKAMWNERYGAKEYAYGTEPNAFFKTAMERHGLEGRILLPAEGEGRNAVHAAKMGCEVVAFDISEEGRKKALQLAGGENVALRYEVGDFMEMDFAEESFDGAGLIYAHFPPPLLSTYHAKIARLIKPGGLVVLEGFAKSNLPLREKNPQVGGPNKLELLFSVEEIAGDFPDFEPLELAEVETRLEEGLYHVGLARVVRFVGRKQELFTP